MGSVAVSAFANKPPTLPVNACGSLMQRNEHASQTPHRDRTNCMEKNATIGRSHSVLPRRLPCRAGDSIWQGNELRTHCEADRDPCVPSGSRAELRCSRSSTPNPVQLAHTLISEQLNGRARSASASNTCRGIRRRASTTTTCRGSALSTRKALSLLGMLCTSFSSLPSRGGCLGNKAASYASALLSVESY